VNEHAAARGASLDSALGWDRQGRRGAGVGAVRTCRCGSAAACRPAALRAANISDRPPALAPPQQRETSKRPRRTRFDATRIDPRAFPRSGAIALTARGRCCS